MSEVQPRPLEWLWPGWVPLGKLTLLDGDPGQAKSLLLVDLAARVSGGRAMPDGSPPMEADVTFLAPEDGLRDTLRPRLEAAGANLNCIREGLIRESRFSERHPVEEKVDLRAEYPKRLTGSRVSWHEPIKSVFGGLVFFFLLRRYWLGLR